MCRIGSLLTAGRQRERERRAGSRLALHPDPAGMQLDELAGERQPEPGALHLLVRRPHLPELLEDRLLILRRDADPSIAHGDLHAAVRRPPPYLDPPALRRGLDCVGEQVQQYLLDLALVGTNRTYAPLERTAQPDAPPTGPLADQDQGVVYRRRQVEVGQFEFHPPRLDLR